MLMRYVVWLLWDYLPCDFSISENIHGTKDY